MSEYDELCKKREAAIKALQHLKEQLKQSEEEDRLKKERRAEIYASGKAVYRRQFQNLCYSIDKEIDHKLYGVKKPHYKDSAWTYTLVFNAAWFRLQFNYDNQTIEMIITPERNGPNSRDLFCEIPACEYSNPVVKKLLVGAIKLISRSKICPEHLNERYYELLRVAAEMNRGTENEFPLSWEAFIEYRSQYYSHYYQVLCYKLQDLYSEQDRWLAFFDSKWFKAFDASYLCDTDEEYVELLNKKYKISKKILQECELY
jgi:hypothetical protein